MLTHLRTGNFVRPATIAFSCLSIALHAQAGHAAAYPENFTQTSPGVYVGRVSNTGSPSADYTAYSGDFSNDNLNPSLLNFNANGKLTFKGSTYCGNDTAALTPTSTACPLGSTTAPNYRMDIIGFTVPMGMTMTSLILDSAESTTADNEGFIAIARGNTIGIEYGVRPNYGPPSDWILYNHYGNNSPVPIGADFLDAAFTGTGPTQGSLPALPALGALSPGSYTLFLQQTGTPKITYQFTGTLAAPAPLPLLGLASAFGATRRLRAKIKSKA
jgi:hypothetical protein